MPILSLCCTLFQRGYYRCEGLDRDRCTFCPNGIFNGSLFVAGTGGRTCGEMPTVATAYKSGTVDCNYIQSMQKVCCPADIGGSCRFCHNKTVDKDEVVLALQTTCGQIANYAMSLDSNSSECQEILGTIEDVCCLS